MHIAGKLRVPVSLGLESAEIADPAPAIRAENVWCMDANPTLSERWKLHWGIHLASDCFHVILRAGDRSEHKHAARLVVRHREAKESRQILVEPGE